jgi:hypothetical protein
MVQTTVGLDQHVAARAADALPEGGSLCMMVGMPRTSRLDDLPLDGSSGGSWDVHLPDGRRVRWRDQYTGPVVLTAGPLSGIRRRLLGLADEHAVQAAVEQEFRLAPAGTAEPAVLVYSASQVKKCFEADLADLGDGRQPECPAAYIETRSAYLARGADLVCGRTAPWRAAMAHRGRRGIEVPGLEYYYLTHALLVLADQFEERPSAALRRLVDYARSTREPTFRVYMLDDELSVFLLWLKRMAGAATLTVEANGPRLTSRWNQKTSLHPFATEASGLPVSASASPHAVLRQESELTPLAREVGLVPARVPGYSVAAGSREELGAAFATAAGLLVDRYGVTRGCLKPSRSGTGARILTGIPLDDGTTTERLADLAARTGEDYVLEAHVDYLAAGTAAAELVLAPSMHIVDGGLGEGATLQFLTGTVWRGNVYVDRQSCRVLGLDEETFDLMRRGMTDFVEAFDGLGPAAALVKGGVDFAVGRVGGVFGTDLLVGMQDLNLSSHGAEYLRVFRRDLLAAGDFGAASVATRVVRPTRHADLDQLDDALGRSAPRPLSSAVIACVPGRWGMIGVAAASVGEACDAVLRMEEELVASRLCEPVGVRGTAGA